MGNTKDLLWLLEECRRFINSNRQLISPIAPSIWKFIQTLPSNPSKWNKYTRNIILCTSEFLSLFKCWKAAEIQLIEIKKGKLQRLISVSERKITQLLKILEELHRESREDEREFKLNAERLQKLFNNVNTDLEELYDEITQQKISCVKEENSAMLHGICGLLVLPVLGTVVITYLSKIHSFPIVGLYIFVIVFIVAFAYACSNYISAKEKFKQSSGTLDETASLILKQKLVCEKFITSIDVLHTFEPTYTQDDLMTMLQDLVNVAKLSM